MKAVDKAISLSLATNHYYQALQNNYNDKLQYIEKLKDALADKQNQIDAFQSLLEKYNFSDVASLIEFIENSLK